MQQIQREIIAIFLPDDIFWGLFKKGSARGQHSHKNIPDENRSCTSSIIVERVEETLFLYQ